MVAVRFLIGKVWQKSEEMGSLGEISCENPETSFQFPDTSQTYITTDSPFSEPFPYERKKTPLHGVRRVFWVVISVGFPWYTVITYTQSVIWRIRRTSVSHYSQGSQYESERTLILHDASNLSGWFDTCHRWWSSRSWGLLEVSDRFGVGVSS